MKKQINELRMYMLIIAVAISTITVLAYKIEGIRKQIEVRQQYIDWAISNGYIK